MYGYFYFDNISSRDLGIYIIGINSQEDTWPLFGGQSVVEQEVINNDFKTFIKTTKENIKFTLTFSLLDDPFTPDKIYELGNFFAKSIPIEIRLEENIAKVIKVIPTSNIELVRFGEMKGYFQISFQATTPYWMTPLEKRGFNLINNGKFALINKRNLHDKFGTYDICLPLEIKILALNNSNLIISNTKTSKSLIISNIKLNDVIKINNKNINSSLDKNIFFNWNKGLFVLHSGINEFTVNNNCQIIVDEQYPIF